MYQVERPDSSLRLEYPSPKLGLGLESENLWTRDPNESKFIVEIGKNYHLGPLQKSSSYLIFELRISWHIS